MAILTVDEIIAARDLQEKEVEMPEWGGSVRIRGLGYGEFVAIREKAWESGEQDERVFGRLLLAASFVDPPISEDQAEALFNKSSKAVTRISEQIMALSGMGVMEDDEATFPG